MGPQDTTTATYLAVVLGEGGSTLLVVELVERLVDLAEVERRGLVADDQLLANDALFRDRSYKKKI